MTTTQSKLQAARENAFEAMNRARKVLALCSVIPVGKSQDEILRTADFFEQVSDKMWEKLAEHVGVNPPSAVTRAEICRVLRSRQPMVAR